MNVRIYVEGGGDQRATLSACREGFADFFEKVTPERRRPKIIPCGGRDATLDDFRTALRQHPNDFVILLVDSEDAVALGRSPWEHLRIRDDWDRPAEVTDDQAHLMVQCTESWLLADRDALRTYYGLGFNEGALPGNPNVEQVSKADVLRGLDSATRATTTKGVYHKVRHGYQLLGIIDPTRVRAASAYAERLCALLTARLIAP